MDFTGMIFSYTSKTRGKTEYWMITGKPYQDGMPSSSPATKCSLSGKLFKSYKGITNRFLQELVAKSPLESNSAVFTLERSPGNYDILKANIEVSSKITRTKNRIRYLKRRISDIGLPRDIRELARLEAELENLK